MKVKKVLVSAFLLATCLMNVQAQRRNEIQVPDIICPIISDWSGVGFPIRRKRREDRPDWYWRWCSYLYSFSWQHSTKVGRYRLLCYSLCRWLPWGLIWEYGYHCKRGVPG